LFILEKFDRYWEKCKSKNIVRKQLINSLLNYSVKGNYIENKFELSLD